MNERASAAYAASLQVGSLRDGVADTEKLPVAERRGRLIVRKLTTQLTDALAERGYCDLVADPPTAPTRAGASVRALARLVMRSAQPDWWSGLIDIDSLALMFPAQAHGAR